MKNKHIRNTSDGRIIIQEGTEVKGGLNPKPSAPRPSVPPKAQNPVASPPPK